MTAEPGITMFHAPQTRSTGTMFLLEELGAPYDLHLLDMKAGAQRKPEFLAVNPMGKVPAIKHGEALVTEQPAVFLYLADLFPAAGLAPAIGDALRGPYLRWMVFYGSSFEPAVVDHAMKREPAPASTSPYGSYETVMDTLSEQLKRGPYLLGARLTAADILWGTALAWTIGFKIVPERPEYMDYVARITARPAYAKISAQDAAWAADFAKAAGRSA